MYEHPELQLLAVHIPICAVEDAIVSRVYRGRSKFKASEYSGCVYLEATIEGIACDYQVSNYGEESEVRGAEHVVKVQE